jgi:thiosulfate dehydrogenase
VGCFIAILYVLVLVIGFRLKDLSALSGAKTRLPPAMWEPPSRAAIPSGSSGDSIRLGEEIFNDTPVYAAAHTGAKLSCNSCHAGNGIQPYAAPMVGLPKLFPMFNKRAGHVISLEDRIQECFVRSENGKPLDYSGREMRALVDYINWLSQPTAASYIGRGFITLPELQGDPKRGATIYASQCAGCHGLNGEGLWPNPPLWGPDSFNDGAGMNSIPKMAAFVQHNMPENRKGILSHQEAYDVSAYIHSQIRPAFNPEFARY